MHVSGFKVCCVFSSWWRAGWIVWRWWKWRWRWRWWSPRSAPGFHVTACIIRYGAKGSALVEMGAVVFSCLQCAPWVPWDFSVLHTWLAIHNIATVLQLYKGRQKSTKKTSPSRESIWCWFSYQPFSPSSCWLRAERCHQLESDQLPHGNDTLLIFSEAVSVWTSEDFHISTPCCCGSSSDGTVCNSAFPLLSSMPEKYGKKREREREKSNLLVRRGSNCPHTHAVAGDRFIPKKNDLSCVETDRTLSSFFLFKSFPPCGQHHPISAAMLSTSAPPLNPPTTTTTTTTRWAPGLSLLHQKHTLITLFDNSQASAKWDSLSKSGANINSPPFWARMSGCYHRRSLNNTLNIVSVWAPFSHFHYFGHCIMMRVRVRRRQPCNCPSLNSA